MGKLKINGDLLLTGSISFQTPNCITPAFSAKVDSNGYGQNLLIGAGGNTIIGGGEGAQEFFAAAGVKDEENIYLAATDIHMYTDCNDIAKRKLVMSLNADGTITLPNRKKIDTDGTFSGNAAGIYRVNHFTTEAQVDSFQAPNTLQYCTIGAEYTPIGNDGVLICAGWSSGRYGAQIWIDDGGSSGGMKIRSFGANNGANWNEWQTVLTSGNYNSYAPSLTGTGASGNWNISVKNLYYAQELSTAELLDGFNEALRFKAGYWTNSLVPGCGNGIILNMGWTSATYGAQLAIDDDPTYFIALRQKNGSGWADWKRIPMGDGTGASGTWGINVTGSAGSVAWGNVTGKPSTYAPSSHTHSYVPLSGGTMTGTLRVNNAPIFGYMYGANYNAAAFIWDKNGSNYTGVGACNITDVIHFGPCNASGDWVANYNQIWRFQGGVYAMGWFETDNYGSSAPGSSTPGHGRGGAIYYQI